MPTASHPAAALSAAGPLAAPRSPRLQDIAFPGDANHGGILHGGPALSWRATAALVAVIRRRSGHAHPNLADALA